MYTMKPGQTFTLQYAFPAAEHHEGYLLSFRYVRQQVRAFRAGDAERTSDVQLLRHRW